MRLPAMLRVASVLLAALLLGACSGETGDGSGSPHVTSGETTFREGTLAVADTGEDTAGATIPENTTGQAGSPSEVLLRLEGDPKTGFAGLCSAGGQESVLSGSVPKRFSFDLNGGQLACRIEKRGGGRLRVVLVAGDSTRSVQQTNAPRGVINVSYSANQGG